MRSTATALMLVAATLVSGCGTYHRKGLEPVRVQIFLAGAAEEILSEELSPLGWLDEHELEFALGTIA